MDPPQLEANKEEKIQRQHDVGAFLGRGMSQDRKLGLGGALLF